MTDLTHENPTKTLIKFALPMVLSVAFQQVYNIADELIGGRYAGEDALATVSASYPITMIIMATSPAAGIFTFRFAYTMTARKNSITNVR